VKYVEKYRFQEQSCKNKPVLLSASENFNVVRNNVSAFPQSFVATALTFPEKDYNYY
jgi:hypothetical protein